MVSHIWGIFYSFSSSFSSVPPSKPSLVAQIPVLRPKSQPQGLNPSLEAQISAVKVKILSLRPKSHSWGQNLILEAQIPASRPKSQFEDQIKAFGAAAQKEEIIPHMCESIGHRPLQGRCPAPSALITAFISRVHVPLTI